MKYILILLLTVTAFAFDYPIALQEVALYSGDLAGYWKLQGNALDYSGNGNNGTVVGAVSTGTNYYFDGVDDYIDVGNKAEFNFDTNDFAISAWVNTSAGGNYMMIVDKKLGSGTYNGYILEFTSANKAAFAIRDNSTTKIATSVDNYNDGVWHFFVGVKLGDNLYIYVDDELKGTATGVLNYNATTSQSLSIGARSGGSYPFDGYIKDVRIYDRALTSNEISNIYNETLLKHTINLFDSKPTTVTDLSAEGNDGTVYGATMTDNGMSFNGVNDYINIGNINAYSESVSLWFYNDNTISKLSTRECVIQLGITDANNYYFISFGAATSTLTDELITVLIKDNTTQYRSGYTSSTATIATGWHHLAVIRSNDSENYYIYLDGVKVNNAAVGTYCPAQSANNVRIAQRDDTDYFDGKQNNVAIYSRAITPSEITTLYNAGRNASKDVISTNGLVLFYDFDVPERTLALQEKTYYYGDLDGWWKLQGNALDYSKNDNDGTVYGAVSTGTNYYFDGVDDYIDCGGVDIMTNLTIMYQCRVDDINNNNGRTIKDSSTLMQIYNTRLELIIWDGGVPVLANRNASGGTYIASNIWYFFCSTYNGTNLKTYINGALDRTGTHVGSIDVNTDSFFIGGLAGAGKTRGYIKDVRIYDRALSATEVNKIYNATK